MIGSSNPSTASWWFLTRVVNWDFFLIDNFPKTRCVIGLAMHGWKVNLVSVKKYLL